MVRHQWTWPVVVAIVLDLGGYGALWLAFLGFQMVGSVWNAPAFSGVILRVMLFVPLTELVAVPLARRYKQPWILALWASAFLVAALIVLGWAVVSFSRVPVSIG